MPHTANPRDVPHTNPLKVGGLIFDGLDQIDLTGPFEVLSKLSNTTIRLYGLTERPVHDMGGLTLTPDDVITKAPQLDVLIVPGGAGQEALMDDDDLLTWLRNQAQSAQWVFSVCTGALILGAAGLLVGRRATTHWASMELLPLFGAEPINERVVVDKNYLFAGGVTAGLDAALQLAELLRGPDEAQEIQLAMHYAPEPPFQSGSPDTAPAHIVRAVLDSARDLLQARRRTAQRIAPRLPAQ